MSKGVPDEFFVSLTQTSKGVIYIDKVSIKCADEEKILTKLDKFVIELKKRLEVLNKEHKE